MAGQIFGVQGVGLRRGLDGMQELVVRMGWQTCEAREGLYGGLHQRSWTPSPISKPKNGHSPE